MLQGCYGLATGIAQAYPCPAPFLNKPTFRPTSVERPVFCWEREMAIAVEVTNKMGECVGNFSEKEFTRWKAEMGGKAAFLWEGGDGSDGFIIDTARLLKMKLGHGNHRGVLVVRTKLPELGQAVEAWQLA